jgi:hypothetical protein
MNTPPRDRLLLWFTLGLVGVLLASAGIADASQPTPERQGSNQ